MSKQQAETKGEVSRIIDVTPSQRAAVVIAMLGANAAKPIVDKLDDAALAKVVKALESISFLDHSQLAEIVIDFIMHLRASEGALRGGPERSREILSDIADPNRVNLLFGAPVEEEKQEVVEQVDKDVWTRLQERKPEQIAAYLARLNPNLVSMVLRKLDVSVTSDILCHMEDEKAQPVLGYLVNKPDADPAIDSVIERMIEMEFLNAEEEISQEGGAAHLEAVGELLSLLPSARRDNLVDFLKSEHEGKLESIQQSMFTVEGLPELLPRAVVPTVFREIDSQEMMRFLASLKGAQDAVSEYMLSNISSRMAEQLRDELSDAPTPSAEEIDSIHREFLSKLMTMKRRGVIELEKPATAA